MDTSRLPCFVLRPFRTLAVVALVACGAPAATNGLDAALDAPADVPADALLAADVPDADRAIGDVPRAPDALCVPATCAARDVHCGPLDDGCGHALNCGTCVDPMTCGGGGVTGVCARPPPLPYPTRTAYRIKSLQPDYWSDHDEIANNNTGGVMMNLAWFTWEPTRRAPPCGTDVEHEGHCYTVAGEVDSAIRDWTARGLVVSAALYGSPPWARTHHPCTPVGPGFDVFCAPDDPADFARFVGMAARRYDGRHGHGRIADFVIWNEVNTNDWFDIGCGGTAGACDTTTWIARYATLWSAAYDAIVAEQSTARVLTSFEHHFGTAFDRPAAAAPILSVQTFLRGFAPRVGARAWHVAFHPYPADLRSPDYTADDFPEVTYGNLGVLVGWLRDTFRSTPSAWQVELTESGISSLAPTSSPAAQVTGVCDSFRNVLGTPGIDNYVYHRMLDNATEVREGLALGLRNVDHSAKPAWSTWALANRNDLTPPRLSCGFEDLPYVRLQRSVHATRGHWASTRIAPPGFTAEQSYRLHHDPIPGGVLLYECGIAQHDFLSRDVGCEGQMPLGPVGYALVAAGTPGTVPLYRCRVGAGSDHFISPAASCEGQTMDTFLGYVWH